MSRASEASMIGLGVALALFGGALLWKSTDIHQTRVAAGVLAAGLLLLPSVASAIAAGVRLVGTALAEAWRAKEAKP